MALGLLRSDELIRGEAEGPGNPIMAVGAPTDRAGIHGATWASASLEEGAGERASEIPVGDPELERRLMQASLALIASAHIDQKSTRLNSSHVPNPYGVFCLKKQTAA